MKTALTILMIFVLSVLAGCDGAVGQKELLTADFQEGQSLRYKFNSSKDIKIDWNPTEDSSRSGKNKVDKFSESMEMVVAYRTIESDPYGLTTIEATCESVKVNRSSSTGRASQTDAVESLVGRSFTFTVSAMGKIEDYSQIKQVIKEAGEKTFRADSKKGRIKNRDMIGDFIATQWFLWDSISSIENAAEGVEKGQSWQSKLSIPTPMVTRKARNVTYRLDEIRRSPKGRLAVIRSSYKPAESVGSNWPPSPYSGRFQMRGTFGFLRGHTMLDLEGEGEELFNIDTGRTEQYNQNYEVKFASSFPFSLGVNTQIIINQNLTMQLLE